jgi:transcriptional antiterminator NusG
MPKRWYVIHTYSGCESKVKDRLEDRLERAGMNDKIGQILVPTEDVIDIRKGKKRVSTRKFFPGYIIVEMDMTDEIWYLVKNTPKVTGFLGGANNPTPLADEEVERLLGQLKDGTAKPKPKVLFEIGENVRVIDGPFTNFVGIIDEVNSDRGKVKVMVSIFGRATPVELEFPQIEKV